jgi:hypothetical protein
VVENIMSHLTPQQVTIFKNHIAADPVLSQLQPSNSSALQIADALNLPASPTFIVWKRNETLQNIGAAFNAAELAARSAADQTRLQTIAAYFREGLNPSLASVRTAFDDIFSGTGGTLTRTALLALWKRSKPATRFEKLFATGTGSDASPAILVFEEELNYIEVNSIMGWTI